MGAAITLERRLEWIDTDAAVRWHHSTVWRYAEAAEAELHRRLGIIDRTFGFTPRRRLEAEFHAPLQFDDVVTVDLRVTAVGRTSATYDVSLRTGGVRAASAVIVIVFTDAQGRAHPWPPEVARALRDGVAVTAEP
ncbi:MAG TPA: thioesterase family protein [Euzebyales bacterium]|nr:thioesterase family protein [Euzebyales bacterium]